MCGISGIEINLTNYSVLVDGQNVEMPPKELELLYFLHLRQIRCLQEQLLDQIWGYEYIGDTRTVDVLLSVCARRSKIIMAGNLPPYGALDTSLK